MVTGASGKLGIQKEYGAQVLPLIHLPGILYNTFMLGLSNTFALVTLVAITTWGCIMELHLYIWQRTLFALPLCSRVLCLFVTLGPTSNAYVLTNVAGFYRLNR